MYAVTSTWLVSLTLATLRSAEFGFFGVVVYTRVHTPRRCGLPLSAGVFVLPILSVRPLRTNCWIVGMCWRLLPSRIRDEAELRLSSVHGSVGWSGARVSPPISPGTPADNERPRPDFPRKSRMSMDVLRSRRLPVGHWPVGIRQRPSRTGPIAEATRANG